MLSRAWQNEYEGWIALSRAPEGQVCRAQEVGPGFCACWWRGEPGGLDNYLHVAPGCALDPQDTLDRIEADMAASREGTNIRMIDPDLDRWGDAAELSGFTYTSSAPVMVCELDRRPVQGATLVPAIHVAKAQNRAEYTSAIGVARAVYGGAPSISRFFSPYGPVSLFLGTWNGQPAASATLWPFAGVAGVYSVAVLPQYRHRGLATAVVRAVLDDAARCGYALASLRTMDDLAPLYEALGFRTVGRLHNWHRPA